MQKKLKIAIIIIFFTVALIITIMASIWVSSLRDPLKLANFQDWVATLGVGGWFLLFAIQYVQIIVAFIPGGPVQIVAGGLFGPWGGLALCLSGTLLATATVFFIVSRFGQTVISLFVEERDINEYRFLKDEKRLERLVLVLFFIPGAPKDALTYLFALTSIPMPRFMLLSTVARIPAIATSLIAGQSITEGRWDRAVVMFIIIAIVGIAGFFLHGSLKKRLNKGKDI